MTSHEGLVAVQAAWNGWQSAEVRLSDLHDLHWFVPPGAHSSLLHAWIGCTSVVMGCIPHACDLSTAPHRLRVCLLKSHTAPGVYAQLARRVVDGVSHQDGEAAASSGA